MDSDTSTDSSEMRDTVPEIPILNKDKGKSQVPIDRPRTRSQMLKQSIIQFDIELITQKAKGITISDTNSSSKSKKNTPSSTSAKSKRKSVSEAISAGSSSPSKRGRGSKRPIVVRSTYNLRSGPKGMDLHVPTPRISGKKRKDKRSKSEDDDAERFDPVDDDEVCKKFKRVRKDEDDRDKDGAGFGSSRATRASIRHRKVSSA